MNMETVAARRNLGLALGSTLATMAAIFIATWLLDPLRLGSAVAAAEDLPGIRHPFWHKVFAVTYVKPGAVMLGTSRAGALDTTHPGFPESARPIYNLALAGTSIEQLRDLLMHAHATRPLKLAVVGLDLEAFVLSGRPDFDAAVLAGNSTSIPTWLNRIRINLSWYALETELERLLRVPVDGPAQTRPGRRELFRLTEFRNFHARLADLYPRWTPRTRWDADPHRAVSMRAFGELVAFAHRENIDLRLFISPVHARYLEMYRRVGWWPVFEAWKVALVTTLAEANRGRPQEKSAALWDFSGFNHITMEAVPSVAEPDVMRWYSESSHYTAAHGNLILSRVLGSAPHGSDAAGIGVLIDTGNIENHLRRIWRDADAYRTAFPADAAEVGAIADFLRGIRRK